MFNITDRNIIAWNGIFITVAPNPGRTAIRLLLSHIAEQPIGIRHRRINIILSSGETFREGWTDTLVPALNTTSSRLHLVNWHHTCEYVDKGGKLLKRRDYGSIARYWKDCVEEPLGRWRRKVFEGNRFWPSLSRPTPPHFDYVIEETTGNCSLGLNEPGSNFSSPTRFMDLSDETIEEIRPNLVPTDLTPHTRGITLGLGDIAKGRIMILAARGENKIKPVLKAIFYPPSKNYPASIAQRMAAKDKKVVFVVSPEIFAAIQQEMKERIIPTRPKRARW